MLSMRLLLSGGREPMCRGRSSPISKASSKLREQNRSQVARWLIWLLVLATLLVFALVWYQSEPDAILIRDVFRALVGLAGLAGWFYFGRPRTRKGPASPRELRVKARLHIEQRDGTRKR